MKTVLWKRSATSEKKGNEENQGALKMMIAWLLTSEIDEPKSLHELQKSVLEC